MIKIGKKSYKIMIEILFFSILIFFVNLLFFSNNPGFVNTVFNPYLILALIVSAYYGKIFGLSAFLFVIMLMMIPINNKLPFLKHFNFFWETEGLLITGFLIGVYIFGLIHDSFCVKIKYYQKIAKNEVFEKMKYKNEVEALSAVNNELEERVLRQNESVTSLYSEIKGLHTQNLTETLNLFLATVNKFSWAEKASIFRYDSKTNQLIMIANIGWERSDFENSIMDVDDSIGGWCFRNNLNFSIRMLLEYENLRKMDNKQNILTYPIVFSSSSWGILNIEEMPFTKYNLYVEKILSILIDLAAPEIERAVNYESIVIHKEINEYTGLPSYEQFHSLIEININKAISSNKTFSVIVVEIQNFSDLSSDFGIDKSYKLMILLMAKLNELAKNKIDFFHFKEDNQIAIYYPDIDYDGASLFCLETLGIINGSNWVINDQKIVLDAILGYSSLGHQELSVEELFIVAENLLEMQKV